MGEDKISVIVPVYNVEKYLKKSIDSILGQTYSNFELILVDDGSTDSSGEICDSYALIDERIVVIHKKNGGLSEARNYGIEKITGKYVTFVDSDDYIDLTYIEYLHTLLKRYNTNISICACNIVTENGKIINCGLGYEEVKLNKTECFRRMLNEQGFSVSSCGKMFDVDLLKKVRFPVGKLCEDNGTTYKLIDKTDFIAYGNLSKYNYLKRKNSIMGSCFSLQKLDMIELTDEMCDYIDCKFPNLINTTKRRRIYARLNILRQMQNKKTNMEIRKKIHKYVIRNRYSILLNPESSFRDKVGVILLLINFNLFLKCWTIYEYFIYEF